MSECRTLHETIIKDIVDLMSDVADSTDSIPGLNSNRSFRSVAAASQKLTLVFPVFVSSNIDIQNAVMVSKAVERKAVTMMQMLFSAINITTAKDAIEYVSQFHTNLASDDFTVDEFLDTVDKIADMQSKSESAVEQTLRDKEFINMLREDMKNINYTLPDAINETSLNSYRVDTNGNGIKVTLLKEDKSIEAKRKLAKAMVLTKKFGDYNKNIKDMNELERNRMIETDVRKANELVPSMMIINFVNAETGLITNAVIGIKAKLYPIDSADIIERINMKNKDNNGFHNFIRATTREISFWKDFIFALDKAKLDALKSAKRGSSAKMWKVLERRALKSKFNRALELRNDATAISTLVVSSNDVETLKKEFDLNVDKANVIRPIMESYNLMGFAIVNETLETVKFLFDTGDDQFETLSFTHLERESNDGNYKKVINLMTKMAR